MSVKGTYNEREALQLLAQDSEYAFTLIFDHYRPRIYRTARKFLRSSQYAEEIVQEVFLKLWLRRDKASEIENLEAFLVTVARNLTFDTLRKLSNEAVAKKAASVEFHYTEDSVDAILLETQYSELLLKAVSKLPPQQKQVFQMAKVEGLSHEAIATKLNISRLTVKTHMAKALQSLRHQLYPHIGSAVFMPLIHHIFRS